MDVRPYPETQRRFEFEAFARRWTCPRCGGKAQVFNLCRFCSYETFYRWQQEHVPAVQVQV